MTETSVCVSVPSEHDVAMRASGSLLPGTSVKLMDESDKEITEHDRAGEIFVRGPSVVMGYLRNEKANAETFVQHSDGRWVRTGDVGLFTRVTSGNEQLVIVDRIKELIKVMVNRTKLCLSALSDLLTSGGRDIKLLLQSWRHICYPIPQLPTALSSKYLMPVQEKSRKRLWC